MLPSPSFKRSTKISTSSGRNQDRIVKDIGKHGFLGETKEVIIFSILICLNFIFRIQLIVDSLELKMYHGFCPTLLRNCIERLKAGRIEPIGECSYQFVTALFSLIYHIAGFEYGFFILSNFLSINYI